MGYYETAQLTDDMEFLRRVAACYAQETRAKDPETWAQQHIWQVASAPTFGDKYSYAIDTDVANPGRDIGVINDGEILSIVQQLINQESQ